MTGSLHAAPSSDMEAVRLERRTEVDSLRDHQPEASKQSKQNDEGPVHAVGTRVPYSARR